MKRKKFLGAVVCLVAVCAVVGVLAACGEKEPDRTEIPLSEEDLSVLEQWHPSEPTVDEDFEDNKVEVMLRSAYDDLREIGFQDFSVVDDVAEIISIEYRNHYPYVKITKWTETLKLSVTSQHLFELELGVHDKAKVIEACAALNQLDMVLLARPNYSQDPVSDWVPSDTYYDEQWALHGSYGIQAEEAWNYTRRTPNIKVGILEGGADLSHEDLRGWITQGYFSSMPEDIDHGTHVAGIIGARQNDYGIAGIADTTIYLLDRSDLPESLEYAEQQGIRVVNASFAYMRNNAYADYDPTIYKAIQDFDGLLICSAGNEKNNNDVVHHYPSDYDLPNVISVGATNLFGERSDFSNYGANSVDIYAPGESIISTLPNNTYGYMSGTSMAAPQVAGVAAMLLSMEPALSPARVKEILVNTADVTTIGTPNGDRQTARRLNAYRATEYVDQPVNLMFAGGSGTEDDPFRIENETQFRNIAYAHRPVYVTYQGYVEKIDYRFKLMNDIVLQGDWTPIPYVFAGTLDGNNHSITYNMTISQSDLSDNYFGLFRTAGENSRFRNLRLTNCTIQGTEGNLTPLSGEIYVGILAGSLYQSPEMTSVEVINPTIEIDIEGSTVGAFFGSLTYGNGLTDCHVSGGSITNYSGRTGGFAGFGSTYFFYGCSIATTISYSDGDLYGPVFGNSSEAYGVDVGNVVFEELDGCVAAGTLVTLADGSEVPVEQLTGDEMLLVWNLNTGEFDAAPILFLDSDPIRTYRIIDLSFSDGTDVKVMYEHGFWDYDLNKYVYLDGNAAQYLGHWFEKSSVDENGTRSHTRVQLVGVELKKERTAVYSPVTYGHFCYFVNGMLSMPGGIGGLFNTFEVDGDLMRYDREKMNEDIETYGLFTYEEFAQLVPVSERVFEAFNGKYLKVAIGKGEIDIPALQKLAAKYAEQLSGI